MNETNIPGVDSTIPPQNAVSVYSQDAMDDFPVLKAFQQYIDAEQAKARKRVLSLGIFFGVLTGAIIAVFVVLLMNMAMRNQQLNDRLLDFAMKDRDRAPVVVHSAPQNENAAFMASLAAKMEALQSKIAEGIAQKAEEQPKQTAAQAPAAPPQPAGKPSAEALEIERLKAQLAAEREKAAVEKERRRQAELEEYRRKHYPELYREPAQRRQEREAQSAPAPRKAKSADEEIEEILREVDGDKPISYFDDENGEAGPRPKASTKKKRPAVEKPAEPAPEPKARESTPAAPTPAPADESNAQEPAPYSIPVDVKKPSRKWSIPTE